MMQSNNFKTQPYTHFIGPRHIRPSLQDRQPPGTLQQAESNATTVGTGTAQLVAVQPHRVDTSHLPAELIGSQTAPGTPACTSHRITPTTVTSQLNHHTHLDSSPNVFIKAKHCFQDNNPGREEVVVETSMLAND